MPVPTPKRVVARHPISTMLRRIRATNAGVADAAMFALRDGDDAHPGYGTVFQQLVSCIISIRTRDETSLPVSRRLLAAAPSPEAMTRLSVARIAELIRESTFAEAKAAQIRAIAERAVHEFGGELPADAEVLTSFKGVGPKCANLAIGVVTGGGGIAVDVHVHRVTNRWGYVLARTPEETMTALMAKLPKRWWVEINRLLVPFGKHVCTGVRPKCSTCPVLQWCEQVGVTSHR